MRHARGDRGLWGPLVLFALALTWAERPAAGEPFRDCSDCPELVVVPAGSYVQYVDSEQPPRIPSAREVTIEASFALGTSEITRDQFEVFTKATGHASGAKCSPNSTLDNHDWRNPGFPQSGDQPVVCVNWNDAIAYVRWLSRKTGKNYRLPTMSEGLYATDLDPALLRLWSERRPWLELRYDKSLENDVCRWANLSDLSALEHAPRGISLFQCMDGYVHTAPVSHFRANRFGLRDMIGNVWEWTMDCSPLIITRASEGCGIRLMRGGSWRTSPFDTERIFGAMMNTGAAFDDIGFRVARSI